MRNLDDLLGASTSGGTIQAGEVLAVLRDNKYTVKSKGRSVTVTSGLSSSFVKGDRIVFTYVDGKYTALGTQKPRAINRTEIRIDG